MTPFSNSSKSSQTQTNRFEIRLAEINAWLAKNKSTFSAKKEKIVAISDCPRPWG